ncbi:MAG: DUF58 domain-containing protein [Myxococcales bacterium]|nr:DUF58 domain-containing protein [Myxococcales bacterium]
MALTAEGRFLSVFWLLAGAAGLEVGSNQIYVLFSVVSGLLAASLAARRFYRLGDDVAVSAHAPPRVTAGVPFPIEIQIQAGGRPLDGLMVSGPLLPWDGRYLGGPGMPATAAAHGVATIVVPVSFSERGEHHLDPFFVGRLVPLGLTMGPARATPGLRFLVRPRVARIARLAIPPIASTVRAGASRLGHDAAELTGTRPYRPGDPVRDLHARSWARSGQPMVREWRHDEERISEIRMRVRSTATETEFEAAVSLVAGLAERQSALGITVSRFDYEGDIFELSTIAGAFDLLLDHLSRLRPLAGTAGENGPSRDGIGLVIEVHAGDVAPPVSERRPYDDGPSPTLVFSVLDKLDAAGGNARGPTRLLASAILAGRELEL